MSLKQGLTVPVTILTDSCVMDGVMDNQSIGTLIQCNFLHMPVPAFLLFLHIQAACAWEYLDVHCFSGCYPAVTQYAYHSWQKIMVHASQV